jgi:dTDP-4-dehydrorhamnose 3,5-epimerase
MKIKNTPFPNAFVIEPEPFKDNRGLFSRIYCQSELQDIICDRHIVQINHSRTSYKGTVRGMHFQYPPMAEIKMIKCIRGEIYDVIIDVRRDSPTFLQWHGEILSEENMKMMYVPEGFAHGFQTLKENSELIYLHTEFYNPRYEGGIRFNDPAINISWPLAVTDISERDLMHPMVSNDFKGIKV